MKINDAIETLGQRLNLPLKLDDNGMARLEFDGALVVDLEATADEAAMLYAVVCPLPAEGRLALYEALLSGALFGAETGAAGFAIDSLRGEVLLQCTLDLRERSVDALEATLEDFVSRLEHWKKRMATLGQSSQKAAPQRPQAQPPMGMRV